MKLIDSWIATFWNTPIDTPTRLISEKVGVFRDRLKVRYLWSKKTHKAPLNMIITATESGRLFTLLSDGLRGQEGPHCYRPLDVREIGTSALA